MSTPRTTLHPPSHPLPPAEEDRRRVRLAELLMQLAEEEQQAHSLVQQATPPGAGTAALRVNK